MTSMIYIVEIVCQGHITYKTQTKSFIKAIFLYLKKVLRYAKYGTMRFKITLYGMKD